MPTTYVAERLVEQQQTIRNVNLKRHELGIPRHSWNKVAATRIVKRNSIGAELYLTDFSYLLLSLHDRP